MTIAQGASDPPAGEKHFVTVLFSDICDSSGIAQRLELEEYAGLISYFRRVAESVIQRHGGHIVRLEGDGLFATFGHKPTREDDARRATEAALELHDTVARGIDRVVSTGTDFRLHSGVHCGLVFLLDEVGRRKNFDVLSGVSNIANRLGKLAGPGQIFVSAQSQIGRAHV